VLNTVLSKAIVSAPALVFAWPTAQRSEPTLSSPSVFTVNVDGTQRSSNASKSRRTRRGALRIVPTGLAPGFIPNEY
jgi:hypothetical protein